jgi:RimJ/RimL family protein N-acetyltransferase
MDDVVSLHQFVVDLTQERLPVIFRRDRAPTLEEERSSTQNLLDAPNSTLLVAEAMGAIVGVLDFHGGKHEQRAHTGELGVSVARSWRRQGVGSTLIGELERWAKPRGIKRIELHVFSNNSPAIRLYEKLGFALEGRRVGAVEVDGSYIDVIQMGKVIQARAIVL